jgi:hypothetical protein
MKIANDIIKFIQQSIDSFNGSIPGIQKSMYKELVKELKNLDTKNGKILSTVNNLRLILSIKNKLQKIIINTDYIKEVESYIKAFDEVTKLQIKYFADFSKNFSPSKTLKILKEMSIDSTLNSLTEAGIDDNVIEPINELLRINITSGGDFQDLLDSLRIRVITSDVTGLGNLEAYTKQITTDALNQYSANYQKTVSEDLKLEWYRYTGSLLTTSREFCIKLVEKDFVHKSELPTIIKGNIDGHQCHISKSTGLPDGMIKGTNESNFPVYRAGYNCGHQFFAVPEITVPTNIKANIKD